MHKINIMLSLCITHYNRFELFLESIASVMNDDRINEIIVSDDCSDIEVYNMLEDYCKTIPKIKLFRNEMNLGMSLNKRMAVERATNEWVILFDSDNILKPDYIDAFYAQNIYPNIIYAPECALPKFYFNRYSKWLVSKNSIKYFLNSFPMAEVFMNACNYVVNRQRYLDVYERNDEMKGTDTIWFNYLWLKKGGMFLVTPGMTYFHRDHPGSGFRQDMDYNMKMAATMKGKLLSL